MGKAEPSLDLSPGGKRKSTGGDNGNTGYMRAGMNQEKAGGLVCSAGRWGCYGHANAVEKERFVRKGTAGKGVRSHPVGWEMSLIFML